MLSAAVGGGLPFTLWFACVLMAVWVKSMSTLRPGGHDLAPQPGETLGESIYETADR